MRTSRMPVRRNRRKTALPNEPVPPVISSTLSSNMTWCCSVMPPLAPQLIISARCLPFVMDRPTAGASRGRRCSKDPRTKSGEQRGQQQRCEKPGGEQAEGRIAEREGRYKRGIEILLYGVGVAPDGLESKEPNREQEGGADGAQLVPSLQKEIVRMDRGIDEEFGSRHSLHGVRRRRLPADTGRSNPDAADSCLAHLIARVLPDDDASPRAVPQQARVLKAESVSELGDGNDEEGRREPRRGYQRCDGAWHEAEQQEYRASQANRDLR